MAELADALDLGSSSGKECGFESHLSQKRNLYINVRDKCGCSSVGRAPRCQRGCRGFESHHPLFVFEYKGGAFLLKKGVRL